MAPPAAGSSWKRLSLALVFACGLAALGLFVWKNEPGHEANAALIDAVEKQTGFLIAAEDAVLDPAAGMWRAHAVELRTAPDAEPVLRVRKIELKVAVAELLRGAAKIEHATLYGAELVLDLRERPEPPGAQPIDRARLVQWLPAAAEAPETTIRIRTDARDLEVAGLDLRLQREGGVMRGQLVGEAARAVLTAPGAPPPDDKQILKVGSPLVWDAEGLALDALAVAAGASTLRGALKLQRALELELRGDEVALADFAQLVPAGLSGRGRVELRIAGREVTAQIDLHDAKLREQAFERATASLKLAHGAAVLSGLELARGQERYRSDGLTMAGSAAPTGTLRVDGLELQGALQRAGLELAASGRASGELELGKGGTRARLILKAPAIGAYRFESGTLEATVASTAEGPGSFEIAALELEGKLARVKLSGKAGQDGKLALTGTARVELGDRPLEVDIAVRGSARKPETTLRLAGVEAARAGYALAAELSGTQLVRGQLELKNADFSAYLPAIQHAGAPHARVDARIELTRGALDDLRAFEGKGQITKLAFGYGDVAFQSVRALPIVLQNGRVQLHDLDLDAGGTRWTMRGELDLERGPDLTAQAELPLAPLLATAPFVERVEGGVRVSLALRGGADGSLALTGEARPRNAALVIGPLGAPWTQLEGRVSLADGALRFHDIAGRLGSGTLMLSGALALAGARARSADLKLALRDYAFSPQERFDIALEADSTLKWRAGDALPVLGGRVTLARMHYARHVQLPEAVIALGKKPKRVSEPTVAIDLLVGQRAPLTVRNDFLDVELEIAGEDGAVRVVGTDARLGALGELRVLRGRALFRGATLTVRRGVIRLKSDASVVPALDLLADAPAKRRPGGLIHFTAQGDPSRFDLKLRCEASGAVPPPFSCEYTGKDMTCGNFAELTALWACQPP